MMFNRFYHTPYYTFSVVVMTILNGFVSCASGPFSISAINYGSRYCRTRFINSIKELHAVIFP
jgi:hypothetical protein